MKILSRVFLLVIPIIGALISLPSTAQVFRGEATEATIATLGWITTAIVISAVVGIVLYEVERVKERSSA